MENSYNYTCNNIFNYISITGYASMFVKKVCKSMLRCYKLAMDSRIGQRLQYH